MNDTECDEYNQIQNNPLDNFQNNIKNNKIKYGIIMIIITIILFFLCLAALLVILIKGTQQIKDLENQTKQLNNDTLTLKEKAEQFEILNNKMNKTQTQLLEKEIEIKNLKKMINKLSDQIKDKVDYNIGNLVYFNIRIIADFYIGNTQINLCSHIYYENDKLDNSRIKLIAHDEACIWDFQQNGNSFQFTMNSKEEVRGCKIQMFNNNIICTNNTQFGSNFSFESGDKYKYYKIKSIDTGEYLYVDEDKKRDDLSYYISLTKKREFATDFMIKINK